MVTTDVYTYTSRNLVDVMYDLLGESYQRGLLSELVRNPVLAYVDSIDGGRINVSRVQPDALVSMCGRYRFLGPGRPRYDGGALFALCPYGHSGWSAMVYPEPTARLSELAGRWLSEPMPETWLLALHASAPSDSDRVTVSELEPDTFGPQYLSLPPPASYSKYTCYGTLRVCEAGITRLDFLWQADRFYRIRKVNPFRPENAYPFSCKPAILFKGADRSVVFVWDLDRRYKDSHLRGGWSPAGNLYADYLAVMSTVAGFTDLQLQDVAVLASTWWLSAAMLVPMLSRSASRRTSLLLTTDMFGRLSEDMRRLLFPLLRAWPGYDVDTLSHLVSWHRFDDMFYMFSSFGPGGLRTALGTHAELYDSLRVLCSQIGVSLPVAPDASNYLQVFRTVLE